MVRKNTLKTVITIILVFNFTISIWLLRWNLLQIALRYMFIFKRQEMAFWCDRWPYIHSVFGYPCFIRWSTYVSSIHLMVQIHRGKSTLLWPKRGTHRVNIYYITPRGTFMQLNVYVTLLDQIKDLHV